MCEWKKSKGCLKKLPDSKKTTKSKKKKISY